MCDLVFNIEEKPEVESSQQPPDEQHNSQCQSSTGVAQQVPVFCSDLTNPLIEAADIKRRLDQMSLKPACGRTVDFAVFIDDDDKEWNYQLSSTGSSLSVDRIDTV
jgi:hypothetical protein